MATVDKAGVVTALKAGKTKKFVLTVGTVAASKVTLSKSKVSVKKGKTVALTVTAWLPVDTNPKTVAWTSSNKKVVKVSSTGVVKGLKKGKATITVTTWNGKTAKCVVTVK